MITELTDANSTSQIAKLLSQLRGKEVDPEDIRSDVETLIGTPLGTILVAMSDDEIVGMAVVNMVVKLGRSEARIDEVVVDEATRGGGIGRQLMEAAIQWAWDHDCALVELTSRPAREAANKLYQKLGFTQRETNVYTLRKTS
jgi:GNAT superfamily N-acetyltransferase